MDREMVAMKLPGCKPEKGIKVRRSNFPLIENVKHDLRELKV
jgi:hypothetical protein